MYLLYPKDLAWYAGAFLNPFSKDKKISYLNLKGVCKEFK
jgi:hypothetical protein